MLRCELRETAAGAGARRRASADHLFRHAACPDATPRPSMSAADAAPATGALPEPVRLPAIATELPEATSTVCASTVTVEVTDPTLSVTS